MAGNVGNAVSDFLRKGKLLDDQPEYQCLLCGTTIRNFDLKPTLDLLSPYPVQQIYGHVTCCCVMWSEVECKGYAKKSIDPITAQRKRYDDYDKKYAKQERNALQNMPW